MKKLFTLFACTALMLAAAPAMAMDIGFAWDANTESDLAGYRLYQSDTSGSYTYLNPVADIPAGTETYTQAGVSDGTWFWVLTAYDTEGNESGPSNEVTMTVDETAPAAPTNLQFQ